jgi:hypothetical protein
MKTTEPRSAGMVPRADLLSRSMGASLIVALLTTASWVGITSLREIRADLKAGPARFSTQRWAEGLARPASRGQWEAVVADLRSAVDIQSRDASLHETLGNAWMVGTVQTWAREEEKTQWVQHAQEQFRQATRLRPSDGLSWALLASALARAGQTGPALQESALKAIQLGPNEGHIHQAVMLLVLEHWETAGVDLQKWAGDRFDSGTLAQREAINQMGAQFGIVLESDRPAREPARRHSLGGS